LKFSHDGSKLATASSDNHTRVWEWRLGTVLVGPTEGHTSFVSSVVWFPGDEGLVTASGDKAVRRLKALTGEELGEPFGAHENEVAFLTLSTDGSLLASTSRGNTLKLWNATT
ncbi:hypothetical protein HYDPIDRAFT_64952, partial [Hydnomerulius pinastri MD-312]